MLEPASHWIADANGDGFVSIADVGPWCFQAFFFPGDWAIWAVGTYAPPVAKFFELSQGDYGGTLAASVSVLAWLALLIGGAILYQSLRELDRRLTGGVLALYRECLRRLRVLRAWIGYYARRAPRKAAQSERLDYAMEHALDAQELALLQAHAELEPPYALALDEAAAALGLPRHRVQPLIEKLIGLKLLDRSSAGYGEQACMISRAGRALLVFRQLE